MSITTPKRVRVLDGRTDPLGSSRKSFLIAQNRINQIVEIGNKDNCLLIVDAFRTLVTCPTPPMLMVFQSLTAVVVPRV